MTFLRRFGRRVSFAAAVGFSLGLARVLSQTEAFGQFADSVGSVLAVVAIWVGIPVGAVVLVFMVIGASAMGYEAITLSANQNDSRKLLQSKGLSTATVDIPALFQSNDPQVRKAAVWLAPKHIKSGDLKGETLGGLVRDPDLEVAAESLRVLKLLGNYGWPGGPAILDRLESGPPELRPKLLDALSNVPLTESKERNRLRRILAGSADWPPSEQAMALNLKNRLGSR